MSSLATQPDQHVTHEGCGGPASCRDNGKGRTHGAPDRPSPAPRDLLVATCGSTQFAVMGCVGQTMSRRYDAVFAIKCASMRLLPYERIRIGNALADMQQHPPMPEVPSWLSARTRMPTRLVTRDAAAMDAGLLLQAAATGISWSMLRRQAGQSLARYHGMEAPKCDHP